MLFIIRDFLELFIDAKIDFFLKRQANKISF
jgi:hypothetical protein